MSDRAELAKREGRRFRYTGSEEIMIGDRIAFDARATAYQQGYAGDGWDVIVGASASHRLSNPTRVEILTRAPYLRTQA
jgi:hypothetical protein